jgi:transmembrane sensor
VLTAHAKATARRGFTHAYRWAVGGIGVAAAIAALLLLRAPQAPSFQVAGHTAEVGAWLTADTTHDLPVRFSEGTLIALGKGSRGRVARTTRGGAHIELSHGSVDAEVTHVPGALWTFGAGPFEVAVTGTHLDVSWAPETGKFELSVSRGSVLVQGPFIQGPQEVRAGQVCRVDMTRRLMELGQLGAENARPSAAAASANASANANANATLETAEPARTPATTAQSAESAAAQPLSVGAARAVTAESWLEAARVARLAGRPNEERAALLACRKRAPGQPPAAQAAYLLGRASAAAEAAQWFETYLREQPQGLLAREASGRLIESYRASGNSSAAQKAAARYLAHYPNGPHASLARQALTPRSESQD